LTRQRKAFVCGNDANSWNYILRISRNCTIYCYLFCPVEHIIYVKNSSSYIFYVICIFCILVTPTIHWRLHQDGCFMTNLPPFSLPPQALLFYLCPLSFPALFCIFSLLTTLSLIPPIFYTVYTFRCWPDVLVLNHVLSCSDLNVLQNSHVHISFPYVTSKIGRICYYIT